MAACECKRPAPIGVGSAHENKAVPESLIPRRWIDGARVRAERWSRWICFLTALVTTFMLYPGWFFYDSSQQWAWARQMANSGLPHRLDQYMVTSHWPIFNTLINVPFYRLTHEPGLYLFVQALAFNLSLFLLGRALIGRRSLWLLVFTVPMVLSPISMNMSVFQSSDTVVAACALVAVAMIVDDAMAPGRRALLVAVAVVMMSLIRYNALTAAVPLAVVFGWTLRDKWGTRRATACVVGILLATGLCVAAARGYERTAVPDDSVAEGPALRLLEASRFTSDPVVHAVVAAQVRANPRLRQPLGPDCYVSGYWCAQIGGPWSGLPTGKIMAAYFHLLLRHPLIFLRVNVPFTSYGLGLAEPVQARQIGRTDISAPFPNARMVFNRRRFQMLAAFQAALGLFDGLAARAGMMFLLGLVASVCLWRSRLVVAYVVLVVGYTVPILLLASDANFRYLFPVTITAMAILAACCCVVARAILTRSGIRGVVRRPDALMAAPNDRTRLSRAVRSRRNS